MSEKQLQERIGELEMAIHGALTVIEGPHVTTEFQQREEIRILAQLYKVIGREPSFAGVAPDDLWRQIWAEESKR